MHYYSLVSVALLAGLDLVSGHAAIIAATGDAGGQGAAIGVVPGTPRDGTQRTPFQQDSTRFRGANAAGCGETLGGGANGVQAGTTAMMGNMGGTLPQITPGGSVQMTLHQVNADGAGPYTCMIDATGAGTQWQPMQVTTNVPGNPRNGRDNAGAMKDMPLVAAVPAGQTCTGTVAGENNVCMVKCVNPATNAGPFGGCVPVQMAAAGAPRAPGAAPPAAPAPPAAGAPAAGNNRAAAGAQRPGQAAAQRPGQAAQAQRPGQAAQANRNAAANAKRDEDDEDYVRKLMQLFKA